jgi:hypothetical protein
METWENVGKRKPPFLLHSPASRRPGPPRHLGAPTLARHPGGGPGFPLLQNCHRLDGAAVPVAMPPRRKAIGSAEPTASGSRAAGAGGRLAVGSGCRAGGRPGRQLRRLPGVPLSGGICRSSAATRWPAWPAISWQCWGSLGRIHRQLPGHSAPAAHCPGAGPEPSSAPAGRSLTPPGAFPSYVIRLEFLIRANTAAFPASFG